MLERALPLDADPRLGPYVDGLLGAAAPLSSFPPLAGPPAFASASELPSRDAKQMSDAYCSEVQRILSEAVEAQNFYDQVYALDQMSLEAWFVHIYGSAGADPMQAFRKPPAGGVVHRRTVAAAAGAEARSSSIGRTQSDFAGLPAWLGTVSTRAADVYQRHATFLADRNAAAVAHTAPAHPFWLQSSAATKVASPGLSPAAAARMTQKPPPGLPTAADLGLVPDQLRGPGGAAAPGFVPAEPLLPLRCRCADVPTTAAVPCAATMPSPVAPPAAAGPLWHHHGSSTGPTSPCFAGRTWDGTFGRNGA